MTKDNCRIGYPKSQAWILKVLPQYSDLVFGGKTDCGKLILYHPSRV